MSFFETVVAMAFAAFADAPVDVAVVEVGMGGSWDATNVADGDVAVITPIAVDHAQYLGDRPADIAVEKAGIIKPGVDRRRARTSPRTYGGRRCRARSRGRGRAAAARASTSPSSNGRRPSAGSS